MSRSLREAQPLNAGISVVIPLFNKKITVTRAINSALAQEGISVEVIVIDDGSTDGSDIEAHTFGDRIRFVRQKNAGPSAARNHGARLATKSMLVFLDADDELLPGCLAAHAHTRLIAPEVRLSIASFRVMTGDTVDREEIIDDRQINSKYLDNIHVVKEFSSAIVTNVAAAAICIDKDLFIKIGGFDEMLHCWEITDFMYRSVLDAGTIGLPHGVHVVIHTDKDNSQYANTNQRLEHRVYFAHRLLDRIDDVPHKHRPALLSSIKDTMHSALLANEYSILKQLAKRSLHYRKDYPELSRLCMAAALPPKAIRIFRLLKNNVTALGKYF